MSKSKKKSQKEIEAETAPDYETPCEVCGAKPTLPITGMCGPCTFGEADTLDGNW